MLELDGITPSETDNTHANRIRLLKYKGMLPREIEDIFYLLRTKRNKATHDGYDSVEDAKKLLRMAHTLCCWFMECYGYYEFEPYDFVVPISTQGQSKEIEIERKRLLEENEKLSAELKKAKAASLSNSVVVNVKQNERKKRTDRATANMKLSEAETRLLIDEQLRKVGWQADTENLRYLKGAQPQKGKNLAIAEWPTDSSLCKHGSVDYVLFVGLTLVGVVEAKSTTKNVSSVIDVQCRDYSKGIKIEHSEFLLPHANWNDYKAPFLFATNGRPYLKQLEIKSGIWFRDARRDSNVAKPLQNWIDPQGIMEMLESDIEAANQKLSETPYDLLTDKDGLNLRPYQIKAIEKAEAAIISGKKAAAIKNPAANPKSPLRGTKHEPNSNKIFAAKTKTFATLPLPAANFISDNILMAKLTRRTVDDSLQRYRHMGFARL